MTLEELKTQLHELGLPDKWLSVNGPDSYGATVIYYDYNGQWRVYQNADRDAKVYDQWFRNMEDAFAYVYMQAQKEATYYRKG